MKIIVEGNKTGTKPKDFPTFKYEVNVYYCNDGGSSNLELNHEQKDRFIETIKNRENRFIHYSQNETVHLINIDNVENIIIKKIGN